MLFGIYMDKNMPPIKRKGGWRVFPNMILLYQNYLLSQYESYGRRDLPEEAGNGNYYYRATQRTELPLLRLLLLDGLKLPLLMFRLYALLAS